jgi:hypothetical protein
MLELPGQRGAARGRWLECWCPLAALFLAGCAYIGSPYPPLVNIPARVTNLAAVQRAGRIIVNYSVPTLTTEGVAIKSPLQLDLRIGPAGTPPNQFKPLPEGKIVNGFVTYEIPTAEWTGRDVTIAVRSISAKGKPSAWSEVANLPIVPPPEQPSNVKAEATAQGVRVTWDGPPGDFRVFRRTGDDPDLQRLADVPQREFTDRTIEYGTHYAYLVQRIVKLPAGKEAESDPSKPEAALTPEDKFPPAVPAGLRASAAPGSVELSWDRNTESDLAGYRIYRATGGGAFEKIAEVTQIPSYSDHAVEHGKTYRYAISAFDQVGNESERTAPAEVSIP